ncbi:MAG: AAA family ATPase [Deltaproteobacteria bacterium]|nr:AAA family ATPase [Deltaproteobacteria bacterium]
MTPTNEQQKILNADGRVVKINARAGTGKTATLLMIAQENPNKTILYLVFNNRNRQAAKRKFPDNVDIHTIHSFALSALGSNFDGFEAVRPSHYLNNFRANKETLATLTSDFIVFFLDSAYPKPDLEIDPFKKQLSDELREIFTRSQNDITEISRASLNSWYKTKKDCPHDFYLKLSHLENKFQAKLAKYDLVLVDEGQDLSPIMIDILATYRDRIIIVGDSHQQIYSFRYAVDAMQNFTHDELHELTLSFRFGVQIAALTSKFINNGKADHDFTISGVPEKKSQVYFYDSLSSIENRQEMAILCRTNFSLFKNAILLKTKKRSFWFERDITGDLLRTLDVYWLSIDEKTKVKDDLIRSFDSLKELEKYATTISDFQLLKIVEIVNVYKREFPEIVFEFLKRCREKRDSQDRGAVILSTIHAAKGQEYETVIIDEDVISRLEGSNSNGSCNYLEEINVAYVGITRAKKNLYLPAGMKRLFTKEWQDYASKIPVIGVVDAHRNDHPDRRPSISVPEFELGDTVKTLLGYGKIVKIDGDQYLIAMENQIARIWERRSTLVKVQKLPSYKTFTFK